jgi:uncharacterized membrane protein
MELVRRIIHALLYIHPIHALLVHFPIALTAAALFFILLATWKHSDLLEKIAFANISLAAVSTLLAGLAGLLDNARFYGGHAANYIPKIILASILLGITSLTAILRWKDPTLFQGGAKKALYISAYFASFALAAVLGFLGGIIVYGF